MARPPVQFLQQLAGEGLSGAQALQQLREAGFSYSNEAFYQAWGRAVTETYQTDVEAGAAVDAMPTFGEMSPSPYDLSGNYLQKVVLTLQDRETGDLITRIVSIATDDLLTRQDAIDFATDLFQEHAEAYGVDVTGGAYAATQYRA